MTAVVLAGVLALPALTAAAAAPVVIDAAVTDAAASALAASVLAGSTGARPASVAPAADPVQDAEYWLGAYGIRDAWATTRGAGVRIAVIDTGIGRGPAEFAGVVDGTDVSGLGSADGRTPVGAVDASHGSWVASLAASRGTGAGAGMLGVAPDAELLSISAGFSGQGETDFVDQIAEAMRWAVDEGAGVINLSFTTNTLDWDKRWDDAFLYAFDNDVVVVVAAGNRGSGTTAVGAPATIPGVLVVGGVDTSGRASLEASTQGITIAVAAPSESLLGVSADGRLVGWSGTSGAAPIVAGVAALVRAAHPDLDAANVIERIIATATPSPFATAVPDNLYGYGLVDADAAVTAEVAEVSDNPLGSLAEWIRINRRAAATAVPVPSAVPETVAPLPAADPAHPPVSPLLPSADSLLYGTVPLLALTVVAVLGTLGVTAVVRRVRSPRDLRLSRSSRSSPP